jgi:hypothetical protein
MKQEEFVVPFIVVFLATVVFVVAFYNYILYYFLERKNPKEWKSYFANIRRLELELLDEEVRRQKDDQEQQDQRESIDERGNHLQENLRRLQSLVSHARTHRHQERRIGSLRSQLYMDLTRQGAIIQRSLMGLEHHDERYREDGNHRNVDIDNYFDGLRRLTRLRELRARSLQQNESMLHGSLRSQRQENIMVSELTNPDIAQHSFPGKKRKVLLILATGYKQENILSDRH